MGSPGWDLDDVPVGLRSVGNADPGTTAPHHRTDRHVGSVGDELAGDATLPSWIGGVGVTDFSEDSCLIGDPSVAPYPTPTRKLGESCKALVGFRGYPLGIDWGIDPDLTNPLPTHLCRVG